MNIEKRTAAYRLGVNTLIVLAVLTAVEYALGITYNSTVILFVIGLLKAAAIVQNFMHIGRLWQEEGH